MDLKKVRKSKGITQEQMAKKLGKKSKSWYSMIENGHIQMNIEIAKKISKILDVDPKLFFK